MRTWEDRHPPRPNVALGVALLVFALIALACILLLQSTAGANPPPNTNEVAYWCGSSDLGVKYDNLTSTSFTVPDPPEGKVWTLLVLKAGSDESVETGANETFTDPVPGQTYSHSSGKTLSHAILCFGIATTTTGASTTQQSTTTQPSTTIATTTTAATTTQPSTTIATTTTAASTTIATTSTAATTTIPPTTTTLPRTTTTVADCGLCAGQFGTTTTIPATTTTVAATTTTVAPTTTVPPTTTVAPTTTIPVPAPTTLPVTGSESWWLVLFGLCLLGLGGLLVAWVRTTP
jgi:LPXTG-motif cell wall-anchored protein